MIEQIKVKDEGIMAFKIKGQLEEEDFNTINPSLQETLEKTPHPKMYMELEGFSSIEPTAIWEDLKNTPEYLKFDKIAVVGDQQWEKFLTDFGGKLIKPEAKYFSMEKKQEAFNWLNN
ncbi:STAS/SEC14 domain-containing protein [Cytophagaceae bacterium ABcell3]|nr:STAS/SEC14 domain-containing protein [Cytophagaceae bacterium ABcell3]